MPVDSDTDLEGLVDYVRTTEEGFEALFGALAGALPAVEGVTRSVEVIKGVLALTVVTPCLRSGAGGSARAPNGP